MFQIKVPQQEYCDPWNQSFPGRLSSLAKGSLRIAYFYEKPDNSTFRYRVYNMVQLLTSKSDISAAYFFNSDLDAVEKIAGCLDVLIVCRSRYTHKLNELITRVKLRGKLVFFDIDDFVFNTDYANLIVNTLDQDVSHSQVWDTWFGYTGRLGATLKLCDRAITTNEYLADRIREYAGISVAIVPNFLNREQLAMSNEVYQSKVSSGFLRDGRIHLGYFSGTPTHNKDFRIVVNAIKRLLDTDSRFTLWIAGYLNLGEEFQKYRERVVYHPFRDFVNLQRLIGQVEVNLMPLQNNIFTNCKSELKYTEAAIVGTMSIASPTFTYEKALREGGGGYLASGAEWYERIMEVAQDYDSHREILESARENALDRYAYYNQYDAVIKALALDSSHKGRDTKTEVTNYTAVKG